MESPWDGGTKVCSNGHGHMTKMPPCPYMVKTLKNLLLWNKRLMTLKLSMQHWVLEYYQVCSNDDPGLTLTYFMARSNLVPYAFVWQKGKTMDFSKTIVVYDLKIATDDHGGCLPLPRGYIHVSNHKTNCIKSDFKDIFFKLSTNE